MCIGRWYSRSEVISCKYLWAWIGTYIYISLGKVVEIDSIDADVPNAALVR